MVMLPESRVERARARERARESESEREREIVTLLGKKKPGRAIKRPKFKVIYIYKCVCVCVCVCLLRSTAQTYILTWILFYLDGLKGCCALYM